MEKNNRKKIKNIWLCDLTHTYQTLAMNKMPLGIGFIASYCQKKIGKAISINLFKFLSELTDALKKEEPPLVVGFANYAWNQNLNLEVSRRIKKLYPKTVIVFGGPNFPTDTKERLKFLKKSPWIDFYIPFEGEEAFRGIVQKMLEYSDTERVKNNNPYNAVFLKNNKIIEGEMLPRVNLVEVPSPYLNGMFDKYFKKLLPMVQTTRGCPFTCAYCYDGSIHWNRIINRGPILKRELEYIAKKCLKSDCLYITDANFGMYEEDIKTCKIIAELQDKHSWPKIIQVNTGKNNKDRILEAAKITRGAITVTAGLQSTDPIVLKNTKRKNLPLEDTISLIRDAKKFSPGTDSNADIILGLPGDSTISHYKSIKDIITSGINSISSFQFMLLPGIELNSKKSIKKYGLASRCRVLARCFGSYPWLPGEKNIITAEIETMGITSNTLNFKDYLKCRRIDLTIAAFYNGSILTDLYRVLSDLNLSVFDFILDIQLKAASSEMKKIYSEFTRETKEELWESPQRILEFINRPGVLEKYRSGEYGANLIFKYSVLSYIKHTNFIINTAYEIADKIISSKDAIIKKYPFIFDFLRELKKFHTYLIIDFLNTDINFKMNTNFNVREFYFKSLPLNQVKKIKETIKIEHTPDQKKLIIQNLKIHKKTIIGLSQMLSQISLKRLLRKPILK